MYIILNIIHHIICTYVYLRLCLTIKFLSSSIHMYIVIFLFENKTTDGMKRLCYEIRFKKMNLNILYCANILKFFVLYIGIFQKSTPIDAVIYNEAPGPQCSPEKTLKKMI